MINITGSIPRMPKGTLTLKCKLCNHVHSSSHISKEKAAIEIAQQVMQHMQKTHLVEFAALQQELMLCQMRVTSLLVNAATIDLQHHASVSAMKDWYEQELINQETALIQSLGWQQDDEEETEDDEEEETTAVDNLSVS